MPEQNDSDKSCDQLDEMYHGIQGIILQLISNGALRGTRLAKAEGRRSTDVPSCVYWNEVEIEQGGMSILKSRISKK